MLETLISVRTCRFAVVAVRNGCCLCYAVWLTNLPRTYLKLTCLYPELTRNLPENIIKLGCCYLNKLIKIGADKCRQTADKCIKTAYFCIETASEVHPTASGCVGSDDGEKTREAISSACGVSVYLPFQQVLSRLLGVVFCGQNGQF